MTQARTQAVFAAQATSPVTGTTGHKSTDEIFGEYVFTLEEMRKRLPKDVYKNLERIIHSGGRLDPAMADNGSLYAIFDNEYYKKMLSLVKLADILMPNFTEGKMLSGIKEDLLPTKESAVSILKNLKKQGFEKIVLSGISDKDKCGTATLYNGEITFQFNKRFDLNIHGAGDVLSGVFLATLLKGEDFCASVQKAVDFVHDCIDVTVKEGHNLKYGLVIERFLSYL